MNTNAVASVVTDQLDRAITGTCMVALRLHRLVMQQLSRLGLADLFAKPNGPQAAMCSASLYWQEHEPESVTSALLMLGTGETMPLMRQGRRPRIAAVRFA